MRKTLLIVACGWLLCGLALQFFNPFRPPPSAPKPAHLGSMIPSSLPGWSVSEMELGPTESVAEASIRILQFDDFVYRRYSRGKDFFEIYAAYWGPNKMPLQKVASHTPDRCWTQVGWKVADMQAALPLTAEQAPLKPAHWRIFDLGDTRQHVIYWHVVGDELYDYGDRFNAAPDPVKWLRDAFRWSFGGSAEQYFIRINGNIPIPDLLEDPAFRSALETLRPLGLDPESDVPNPTPS